MTEEKPRRDFLKIGSAAVIAGIIAGVGGYYAGGAGAPAVPVTKTVTQTETETVTQTATKTVVTQTPTKTPTVTPTVTPEVITYGVYPNYQQPPPTTEPTLIKRAGISMGWPLETDTMFERNWSNYTIDAWTVDIGSLVGAGITGKSYDFDIYDDHSGLAGLLFDMVGGYKGFDIKNLPRWREENIAPVVWDPPSVLTQDPLMAEKGYIEPAWVGGREGMHKTAKCLWRFYNSDSVCYNPEFIERPPSEVNSWAEILNREWKGKASIQDIDVIVIAEWAAYLFRSGQIGPPEICVNDPTPTEINQIIDFLIDHKKAGQFKAFWPDLGFASSLHILREIVISDAWQPAVYFGREAGVPHYYGELDFSEGGYRCWYWGSGVTFREEKLMPSVYFLLDWKLSGEHQAFQTTLGYTDATYTSRESKEFCGPELYDWSFNGKKTYKPTEEAVPGEMPALIRNALFLPETYTWSKEEGTPDPEGNLRDGEDIKTRDSKTGTIQVFATYGTEITEGWKRFKAS